MLTGNLIGNLIGSLAGTLLGSEEASISPDELANLELWYDIQEANVVKNLSDNVSQINDLSGNARHATQITETSQYLYVDSQINSNPIIRSDGASNNYDFDGTFFQSSDCTIISVQKRTASGQNIIFGADTKDGVVRWEFASDSVMRFTTRSGTAGAASVASITAYAGASEPFRIMAVAFDNVNGVNYYEDGVLVASDDTHIIRNSINSVAKIGKYNGNVARWFTGDLANLICFSRKLSSYELQGVFNFLKNQYNL